MARQSSRPQSRILSVLIDCASSRILCAALLLIQLASTAEALDSRARVLLLFSNSSNGLLKSCYCPNAPWGGLAKRKWLVGQLRSEIGPESVLLVDSGDLFPVEYDASRILTVMRLYEQMAYDAVAIGDQELLGGLDKWRDSNDDFQSGRPSKQTFPWVSAGYSITNAAGARE